MKKLIMATACLAAATAAWAQAPQEKITVINTPEEKITVIETETTVQKPALKDAAPADNKLYYKPQAAQSPRELIAFAHLGFPGEGDFDLYRNVFGPEIAYRDWTWSPLGIVVEGGALWSDARSNAKDVLSGEYGSFSGYAVQYPVGPSLAFHIVDTDTWDLNVEAGVRYVFMQSHMDYEWDHVDRKDHVKINDNIIGVAALDADYAMAERVALFGGLGLQADFMKGKITVGDVDARDNELQGFYLRLGARILL